MAISVEIKAAVDTIRQYFLEENFEAAEQLLDETCINHDHPRLTRIRARFELFKGNDVEAGALLQSILTEIWDVGAWELALAGGDTSLTVMNARHKVLYFPVPKCASTSMLNVFSRLAGRGMKGEDVHARIPGRQPIDFHTLPQKFQNHFCCALVRSPLARLQSFYFGNVIGRDYLVQDAAGKETFYGLATRPTLEEFTENFDQYRRVFILVRNHTEPLVSFLGARPELYSWLGDASEVASLVAAIADHTGAVLSVPNEMRSARREQPDVRVLESLMPLYERDISLYGIYFK